MKKKIFIILIIISFSLVLCQKNDGVVTRNSNITQLTLVKTELGGCNSTSSIKKNENVIKNDSVDVSIKNDSITIFVGLNYICCSPFISDCQIKSDSIILSIKDTCSKPYSCYCRCSCYYTFNFKFFQSVKNNYNYKIVLFDPREKSSRLIKIGTIITQ